MTLQVFRGSQRVTRANRDQKQDDWGVVVIIHVGTWPGHHVFLQICIQGSCLMLACACRRLTSLVDAVQAT